MEADMKTSNLINNLVLVDAILTMSLGPVSYTHLRAHETVLDLVCRLLLEKKKINTYKQHLR